MNCPNCGAVIKGATCDYCGTVFYDFVNLEPGKRTYIRMRNGSTIYTFTAFVKSIGAYAEYSADERYPEVSINLQLRTESSIATLIAEELERY